MSTAAHERLRSVEEARGAVLAAVVEPLGSETVEVDRSMGRVLAEPVVATVTLPPWDNSAMDGYAIRAADVAAATEDEPVRLFVTGEVPAGGVSNLAVEQRSAIRIATGAPIPPLADAVVPVELTTPLDASGRAGTRGRDATGPVPTAVLMHVPVLAGANVREKGSDLYAGDALLLAGTAMSPAAIALTAGAGVAGIQVHRRPRVAVLATGNEVQPAGSELGPSSIPDANGPGLRALVAASGGEAIDLGIAPDDLEAVIGRLRAALEARADAVIVSGGVSVGPYDIVKLAFESIGEVGLWRVAVQPGKPFAFGTAVRPDGGRALLFGLPGNPVSTFVTFELFVRPALRKLGGRTDLLGPVDRAVLLDEVRTATARRTFLRVTVERDAMGMPIRDGVGHVQVRLAHGAAGQGSHVLSALAAADALAVVPEEVEIHRAGDPVELWWLDPA